MNLCNQGRGQAKSISAPFFSFRSPFSFRGSRALEQLTREYGENIPKRNLHFLLGTIAAHPRNFIIIGLLRSPFDPQELARQGQLF